MNKLMKYIVNKKSEDIFIGLIAKNQLDKFYSQFGFICDKSNEFYRYKS
ncbi:MAG: hypothetical protein RSA05_07250 [Cetobacterium sp.]